MTRIAAAVAQARDAERDDCVAHLREKIAEIDALVTRGRVPELEADLLKSRLAAVADGIRTGLHRPDQQGETK